MLGEKKVIAIAQSVEWKKIAKENKKKKEP